MQICFKLVVAAGFGMSSADRIFSHIVEMPFVPPVGMEVIDGDWSATAESLCFADGAVFAFVEPDRASKMRTPEELDSLSDEYVSCGWQKSERILSV